MIIKDTLTVKEKVTNILSVRLIKDLDKNITFVYKNYKNLRLNMVLEMMKYVDLLKRKRLKYLLNHMIMIC